MIAHHGTPDEVKEALDEAFAVPWETFNQQMQSLAHAIADSVAVFEGSEGKNVDAQGLDEADRIVQSIGFSALGLNDPKDVA
jgi:hypothetical protein